MHPGWRRCSVRSSTWDDRFSRPFFRAPWPARRDACLRSGALNVNRAMSAALAAGAERVMAWTDLLDAINVFPVADGDTGHNLALSLAPLLQAHQADSRRMATRLLHAACGNAGNIAVQFLSGLIAATDPEALPPAARQGRDRAYASLAQPLPGTMLSVMDTLVEALGEAPAPLPAILPLLLRLQATVRATPERLPRLREAGVVDSGALGMLLFLEDTLPVWRRKHCRYLPRRVFSPT